ncbi:hypothetical protein CLIM01_11042 [Colletotrichum limetticola]|uniref:Uncharacterized protein n=1 Tax=Colletotrichum limetticola TaxID=1209924 RepID=A0ABQ9PIG2_9PEZI|nr:hypothetical protein CLIM01_11042 [Colletotrichum limetticola]
MSYTSPFLESFNLTLSPYHRERLEKIDKADYSFVLRKVSEEYNYALSDKYLKAGIENLKRYYAVALLDPLNRHAVSRAVDPFWHSHVLFTKEYLTFCKLVYGAFIHHQPLDIEDKPEVERVGALYNFTLATYKHIFKTVDPEFWPEAGVIAAMPVCLHMDLREHEVEKHALFQAQPDMGYQFKAGQAIEMKA